MAEVARSLAQGANPAVIARPDDEDRPRPSQLFFTGMIPSVGYGAEIYGIPPATVVHLRRACQVVHGCAVQGRRGSLVLAALDRDPGHLQGEPLLRWATEWWRASDDNQTRVATLAMSELLGVFQEVAPRFDDSHPWHRAVQGPLSAAIWGCALVGWTLEANAIVDCDGVRWEFLKTPPCVLRRRYKLAMLKAETAKATRKLLAEHQPAQSTAEWRQRGKGPPNALLDDWIAPGRHLWMQPVRSALKGLHSALERHCLMTAFAGTPQTRAELHSRGLRSDSTCFCGKEDTVWHRLWECRRSAAFRRLLPTWVVTRSRTVGKGTLAFTKAWFAEPPLPAVAAGDFPTVRSPDSAPSPLRKVERDA